MKTKYLALIAALGIPASVLPQQYNILFIAVDDLRPELGCYGNKVVLSPNIDRLAATGITFNHAYCQQAISMASRASLLTGMFPESY
ncbi:MAG TPA: sulfatase-like hydrolase/transferase, partial [Bacteroidales bacterium]|nr:sulfatase-like hydrolase/transferase [Bacteroidales bacterium]